jgi:hypothetical protein
MFSSGSPWIFVGLLLDLMEGPREAQQGLGDVLQGVEVAGLEGHESRSAVFLMHLGRSWAGAGQINGECVRQASFAQKADAITARV